MVLSRELAARNAALLSSGAAVQPSAKKTGTTIAGVVYKDGIVLGADTRSTNGDTVADKNCEKIHYISDNIYCCGAGTAADTEAVTGMVASSLKLHGYAVNRQPRVVSALTQLKSHLFRYQGHVSAALVLGGVDVNGPHLHTVFPHGSTDTLPFVTMGSGSLNAMSVFEAGYREDMERDEAIELVKDAIKSGIFNDLGSGSNVDICVISKIDNRSTEDPRASVAKVEYLRNIEIASGKRTHNRELGFSFPRGTTPVLTSTVMKLSDAVEIIEGEPEPMEE